MTIDAGTNAELAALRARVAELDKVIQEVEWRGDRSGAWICPWCHDSKSNGHSVGCKLDAARQRKET